MVHLKALGVMLLMLGAIALYMWLVVLTEGMIIVGFLVLIALVVLYGVAYDMVKGP